MEHLKTQKNFHTDQYDQWQSQFEQLENETIGQINNVIEEISAEIQELKDETDLGQNIEIAQLTNIDIQTEFHQVEEQTKLVQKYATQIKTIEKLGLFK